VLVGRGRGWYCRDRPQGRGQADHPHVRQRPVEQLARLLPQLGLTFLLGHMHLLCELVVLLADALATDSPDVRVLLINNHCISDPTAGVTQSLRTIVEWLAGEGHECRVLTTARFESRVTFTLAEHLAQHGVALSPQDRLVEYLVGRVPVSLVVTRHNDEARPNRRESGAYLACLDELMKSFAPDQLIACNAHPMMFEAMARARRRGLTTAFAVRGFGYYHAKYFRDVDHAFTCSQFLTDVYRDKIGLDSTPLEPPIDWSTVVAPDESRAFVTFVHPARHKGLLVFARLADMLGRRRPDIPVLVVQSGFTAGALNSIPGLDFSAYPQIMAAPPVPVPADYFALTRILLVPSVWEEPFGRVAAEAMINGIPALVGNRGALPHVVGGDFSDGGGGRVLPIPDWMTDRSTALPTESEIEPWYEAVTSLWDDARLYEQIGRRARQIADDRYTECVSRKRHVDYFASLNPGGSPLRVRCQLPTALLF
jgi:glycosyltransferase involved in cell wall biosynthesis